MTEATRGRRLGPDARREQLLTCAARLFGERPYDAVSTSDIAREAGIARGLLNHYFGTKRDLYLEVVRRTVLLPDTPVDELAPTGSLRHRVERAVGWFLDVVGEQGSTFLAVVGGSAIGEDPEVAAVLAAADDLAARRVLELVGLPVDHEPSRAAVRAYGGLVKAAVREWEREGALTREQVHRLLSEALLAIVEDVLPHLEERG